MREPQKQDRQAKVIRPQRRPFLLLAAGLVLCGYGLMWGLPNLFDFAQDSVVPCGTLAQRGFSLEQITSFRYPPFHFWILRVCFAPISALLPRSAADQNLKVSATYFILAARLVSVGMALGTVWLIHATARKLWDESSAFAAALVFVLSPVTLYYAKNANLDIPYVFWLAWTLLFYVRILQQNRPRDYLWFGLVAALAVCTKDQAYGFIILLPVPVIYRLFKRGETGEARKRWTSLGLAAGGFLVPFVLIHNILFDWPGFLLHMRTILGPASEPWREVGPGLLGQLRLLVGAVLRLTDAWTVGGVALLVIGLLTEFRVRERRGPAIMLLVPVVSYYICFLLPLRYVYPRFVLPMMLPLSFFAGRGVMWLWNLKSRRAWLPRAAAVVLVAWVGVAGLALDAVMSNFSRYHAQKWLEKNVPPETTIGYLGDMRDMPRFNKPLDPHPCEPNEQAIREADADLLVLSFQHGHPATGSKSMRPSSLIRRGLGTWGRAHEAHRTGAGNSFFERLVKEELGYVEIARFESALAPFLPEVSESVNRTIVIMKRKGKWKAGSS